MNEHYTIAWLVNAWRYWRARRSVDETLRAGR